MQGAICLRSALSQSAYWDKGDLRLVNHLTRQEYAADPVLLQIIRFFFCPRTVEAALREFDSYSPRSVGNAILGLIEAQLLLACDSSEAVQDELLASTWKPWLPHGSFHFLTKDAPYLGADPSVEQRTQAVADAAQPPLHKKISGANPRVLPFALPTEESDSFFQTLRARRTRRQFAPQPVAVARVAQLLKNTWGIQGYVDSPRFGPLPLKTSPSGGARHPIEVYLMALKVDGVEPGIYHYDAKDHALTLILPKATPLMAQEYCADQSFVATAAALFIMTAVFERTMWKYRHARAYRVVLLDAGHLGQTFCLTATRLGLAPFSTAAFKDTLIERDLKIDGITESVLYVTGIGSPP